MRSHGVPNFPDPSAGGNGFEVGPGLDVSAPAFKAARAFLVFPSTLDMQSPAYVRAAAACGTLAEKLGRARTDDSRTAGRGAVSCPLTLRDKPW
jgi:hypothetical protein